MTAARVSINSQWLILKVSPAITAEGAFKLVENAIVLVQVAQLLSEVIVDVDGLDRLTLHRHVPYLQRQVIARQYVSAVARELDV